MSLPSSSYLPTAVPAGFAPTFGLEQPTKRELVPAVKFDGATKQWIVTDGEWLGSTPAQQAMAIGCLWRKGSVSSAPEVGGTYHEIDVPDNKLQEEALQRTKDAEPVKTVLGLKWVELHSVVADRKNGQLRVGVKYWDLTVDPTKKNPLSLNAMV